MIRVHASRVAAAFLGLVALTISTNASAVRYQRVSAVAGESTTGTNRACIVKVYTGITLDNGCSSKSITFPIPTEWQSGTQSMNVWLTAGASGGLDYASLISAYDDGVFYSSSDFNFGNPFSASDDHYTSVSVPQDGIAVISAFLTNGDYIASYAWEYIF